MAFRRYLSDGMVQAAKAQATALHAWQQAPGCSVELRPSDSVALYSSGRKAFAFTGAAEMATCNPDDFEAARQRILKQVGSTPSEPDELAEQATLVTAMLRSGDFIPLDQQVSIPASELNGWSDSRTQIDLIAAERVSGRLWLIEIKLATNNELDGAVLDQLRRTASLPRALKDGVAAFREHYQRVGQQKCELGLLPNLPALSDAELGLALVVLGLPGHAWARIACWGSAPLPDDLPADARLAVLEAGQPLTLASMAVLAGAGARALSAPDRVPYAPRPSRWNTFTDAEDAAQDAWAHRPPCSGPRLREEQQFGSIWNGVSAYCDKTAHDLKLHREYRHRRSSQAACFHVFSPLVWGKPQERQAASAAWADALRPIHAAAGVASPTAIETCDFEAPHPTCGTTCPVAGNPNELCGEDRSVSTRLDAFLRFKTDDGSAVGIGVEFKYTEPEFGCCGGFSSRGFTIDGQRACVGERPGRAEHCYLLAKKRRKYLERSERLAMFSVDPLGIDGPCPLLGPLNQLYRGHYMTLKLAEKLGCAAALYLVLYDGRNEALLAPERPIPGVPATSPRQGPLDRYRSLLRPERRSSFGWLTLQDLMAMYSKHGATESGDFRARVFDRYFAARPLQQQS